MHSIAFPDGISSELQRAAYEKVARFDVALAQMLIDEWAGALNAGKIKRSPLGYLHELAARLDRNQFRRHYADDSAQVRAQMKQAVSDSGGQTGPDRMEKIDFVDQAGVKYPTE